MKDAKAEYWEECIAQSLEEHGVVATPEQIKLIALDVEAGHDCYSQAFGHDRIPNPVELELKQTQKKLYAEREKVACRACNGTGRIISYGGTWQVDSQCGRCHGEGKHDPRRSTVPA